MVVGTLGDTMEQRSLASAPTGFRSLSGNLPAPALRECLRPCWTTSFSTLAGHTRPFVGRQLGHTGFPAPLTNFGQILPNGGGCGGVRFLSHRQVNPISGKHYGYSLVLDKMVLSSIIESELIKGENDGSLQTREMVPL